MIQLDQAEAAIQKVLTGQLFDVPDGSPRSLVYYKGERPAKRSSTTSQDNDVSYCHLSPGGFRFTRQGLAIQVQATFVLYSAGQPADGLAMIETTINNLNRLAGAQYTPCSLVGEINGNIEEIEHPYYWLEITLQLSKINEV